MTPIPAHEEWLAELEQTGKVTVRQSRAKVGLGLLAVGAIFLGAGLFLLATPGYGLTPLPVLRAGGWMAVVLAVVFLAGGVWGVARPSLVVQLRPEGVRPAIGPVVPWAEVVDARVVDVGTTPMPAVTVAPAYVERDPGLTGWRRRGWNLTRSMYGNTIPLRNAPPGGNEEVVRLILVARDRAMGRR